MGFLGINRNRVESGRCNMSEAENIEELDKKYIGEGPSAEFADLLEKEKTEPEQKKVAVGQKI